ncbi:MAG: transcriptional regulator [Gammaproteobacteria bacterium]|nr:transcriptional regulator [Gammaproteobacteria bacterium]
MAAERKQRALPPVPALTPLPGFFKEPASSALLRLVNERARLGILSALAVNVRLSFAELKQALRLTDGNLSMHARKLEDAGFVASAKSFHGRRPLTSFTLTPRGRGAFERYLDHMQSLITHMREADTETEQ